MTGIENPRHGILRKNFLFDAKEKPSILVQAVYTISSDFEHSSALARIH